MLWGSDNQVDQNAIHCGVKTGGRAVHFGHAMAEEPIRCPRGDSQEQRGIWCFRSGETGLK